MVAGPVMEALPAVLVAAALEMLVAAMVMTQIHPHLKAVMVAQQVLMQVVVGAVLLEPAQTEETPEEVVVAQGRLQQFLVFLLGVVEVGAVLIRLQREPHQTEVVFIRQLAPPVAAQQIPAVAALLGMVLVHLALAALA